MTREETLDLLREVLGGIAPEVDLDEVDPESDLQAELDIDSIDFLNLVDALHKRTGIEVPERDYPQLATLDGCISYLAERAA